MSARKHEARIPGGRRERPTVLIACEGETELNYFSAMKAAFRASWIIPEKSDVPQPMGVIAYAQRRLSELKRKGLDARAWIVVDAESEAEEKARRYRDALVKAAASGMGVANSSPCFEYWMLIHYAPGIMVFEPGEAKAALAKPGRIPGYQAPDVPFSELWCIYKEGIPSDAAERRRADIERLGENPIYARPVTYVDQLVGELDSIQRRNDAAGR